MEQMRAAAAADRRLGIAAQLPHRAATDRPGAMELSSPYII
jgi:hypothetical protein